MARPLDSTQISAATAGNARRAIGLKMTIVARQLRQSFDDRVEKMGVTRAKWVLIATVAANPGTTQREIAAKLEVSDVTAGRLIDKICADGLLERRKNAQDRRAYNIYLTPDAQPVMAKLARAAELHEAEIYAGLSDAEIEMLETVLDKMAQNIANGRRDSDGGVARHASLVAEDALTV